MPAAAKTKSAHIVYTVEGSRYGEFPLDMLRRDDASALTGDDKMLIDRLSKFGSDRKGLPKRVRVCLVRPNDRFGPYVARWESFGWQVIQCSDPTILLSTPKGLEGGQRNPNALRAKAVSRLHDAVAKLNPYVHMAEPASAALKFAAELAAEDLAGRAQAIGYIEGVARVLGTGKVAGFLTGDDVRALTEALSLARRFMLLDGEECRQLYIGDDLTGALHKVEMVGRMFGS